MPRDPTRCSLGRYGPTTTTPRSSMTELLTHRKSRSDSHDTSRNSCDSQYDNISQDRHRDQGMQRGHDQDRHRMDFSFDSLDGEGGGESPGHALPADSQPDLLSRVMFYSSQSHSEQLTSQEFLEGPSNVSDITVLQIESPRHSATLEQIPPAHAQPAQPAEETAWTYHSLQQSMTVQQGPVRTMHTAEMHAEEARLMDLPPRPEDHAR